MQKVNYKNQFCKVFIGGLFLLFSVNAVNAASVSLSATPTLQTITEGQNASYTIKILRNNYTEKVTLSVINLPIGATAVFSPNNTTGNSSTLTITTKIGIQTGSHQLSVRAAGSSITSNPIAVKLVINPTPSVRLTANPTSRSIFAGQEAVYEITFNRFNYAGSVMLNASGLPINSTASFSYDPGNSNKATVRVTTGFALGNSMTNFTVGGTAANGVLVYPITLKLRTNCNTQWTRQIGWASYQFATDVTTDRFGNVIVVGAVYIHDHYGNSKAFIAKYYSDGTLAWTRLIDADDPHFYEEAVSVITDEAGNIFVGGVTDGILQWDVPDPTPGDFGTRWWVAKLDINGVYHWVRQDPTDVQANSVKIALDGSNNIILYAANSDIFQKAVFNAQGQSLSHTSFALAAGNPNNFVSDFAVAGGFLYTAGAFQIQGSEHAGEVQKYNLNGAAIWNSTFNMEGVGSSTNITVDTAGNVFVGGRLQAGLNEYSSWVRKLDNAGNLAWHKRLPLEDGELRAIEVNSDGNLLVAGHINSSAGDIDQWFSKLNTANGSQQWIRKIGSSYSGYIGGLHSDSSGNIYVAGNGYEVPANNFPSGSQVFLIKYSDPAAVTLPSNIFTVESVANPGQTITLLGNNLSNVEEILIGDRTANFTIISSMQIRITVPAGSSGEKTVTVRAGCESVRSEAVIFVN